MNRELARLYPDARLELNFSSPLELLVAAVLDRAIIRAIDAHVQSEQATDEDGGARRACSPRWANAR